MRVTSRHLTDEPECTEEKSFIGYLASKLSLFLTGKSKEPLSEFTCTCTYEYSCCTDAQNLDRTADTRFPAVEVSRLFICSLDKMERYKYICHRMFVSSLGKCTTKTYNKNIPLQNRSCENKEGVIEFLNLNIIKLFEIFVPE